MLAINATEPANAAFEDETKLTASDAAAGDQFGWSVSVGGDTAIVGSAFDDDGGSFSGSAYIFESSTAIPTPAALPAGLALLVGLGLCRRRR